MRPEPSVHDNILYAYTVDCEGRQLVLHTAYRLRDPHEFTDLVFREVVAHHFDNVLAGNILFEVDEVELAALVGENAALFAESWRYGWPINYSGDSDALVRALTSTSVRAYSIGSSYGLSGWILAGSCERVCRSEAAKVA
jgi:hypothetical protein